MPIDKGMGDSVHALKHGKRFSDKLARLNRASRWSPFATVSNSTFTCSAVKGHISSHRICDGLTASVTYRGISPSATACLSVNVLLARLHR